MLFPGPSWFASHPTHALSWASWQAMTASGRRKLSSTLSGVTGLAIVVERAMCLSTE